MIGTPICSTSSRIETADGNVQSDTAFLYAARRFATCAHNIPPGGTVCVRDPLADGHQVLDVRIHPGFEERDIDLATFTISDEVDLPAGFIRQLDLSRSPVKRWPRLRSRPFPVVNRCSASTADMSKRGRWTTVER